MRSRASFTERIRWLMAGALFSACQSPSVTFLQLVVQPAQLSYMTMSPSPPVDQTLTVTNAGHSVVHISSIKLSKEGNLTLPASSMMTTDCEGKPRSGPNLMALEPRECATVVVRYTPTVPETLTAQVVVASDVPETPEIATPVTAVNQWPPPVCPVPPVAKIQASDGSGPLASNGSTTPGPVNFSSSTSTASGGATIAASSWILMASPPSSTAELSSSGSKASINVATAGQYQVALTVLDSNGCTSQPTVFPFSVILPPCWNVPKPPQAKIQAMVGTLPLTPDGVLQDTTVSLDGSGSIPGTNPITSYHWSIASAPAGNTSSIVANGPQASLDCTSGGIYVVDLVVDDSASCPSRSTSVTINVAPLPALCGPATEFIYAVDASGVLYQFTPSTQAITALGTLGCNAMAGNRGAETMAVDKYGIAWVVYTDGSAAGNGQLYRVDTQTLKCWPTGFDFSQVSSAYWGSCFARESTTSADETYFIQYDEDLAAINPSTLALTTIGQLSNAPPGAFQAGGAELTGTSNGDLYAFFPADTWAVAQVDRSSAAVSNPIDLQVITDTVGQPQGWAFASWGEDFWFFVAASSNNTDIFHYDSTTGTTTLATTVAADIDGAGVSPCVQVQ
jgi:hypothetical protein